jgi:hypothetical protein
LVSEYSEQTSPLKLTTPTKVASLIDEALNVKKVPRWDKISGALIRELPKKGMVMLIYIFNAALRLRYFPQQWKVAKIILVPQPGNPAELPASYRPLSVLPRYYQSC